MTEQLNSRDIRANNVRNIIYQLRQSSPITRKELANSLGLSIPTITNISKTLVEKSSLSNVGVSPRTSAASPRSSP